MPFNSVTALALFAAFFCAWPGATAAAVEGPATGLIDLSLEELLRVEITSASKKVQRLGDVAAAVFVIGHEDIRHSGATSIPELLRMAPGVDAARISGNRWAVSIRGFNGRFANKLLVLVDGRSVYTPQFSGALWEDVFPVIEDIERIEVIRGPGASIWGANAVNGVINIISKSADATPGGLARVRAGSEEQAAVARYGTRVGDDGHLRVFATADQRGTSELSNDSPANDDARRQRAGFRYDGKASASGARLTVTGEAFNARHDDTMDLGVIVPGFPPGYAVVPTPFTQKDEGWHVLGQWRDRDGEHSGTEVHAYFEHTRVAHPLLVTESRDTFDIEMQRRAPLSGAQDLIWGLGYRNSRDEIRNGPTTSFSPASRTLSILSAFFQDDITLMRDRLDLSIGARLEHHDYTGWEFQPNARLLWHVDEDSSAWLAVSRAARTPSRGENDAVFSMVVAPNTLVPGLPAIVTFGGYGQLKSEYLTAYEAGFRRQWGPRLSVDATMYLHRYTDVRGPVPGTVIPGLPPTIPFVTANTLAVQTHGLEAALDWRVREGWRISGAYTYARTNVLDDARDINDDYEGGVPRHLFSLRSHTELSSTLDGDLWLRYVAQRPMDKVPDRRVGSYLTLDARLAWTPRKKLELSLVGQNLLGDHTEFVSDVFASAGVRVQRGVYGQARWEY